MQDTSPAEMATSPKDAITCTICGYHTDHPQPAELGMVRGNTRRFKSKAFRLWRCPRCTAIHSLDAVDYSDIYRDYPLNQRRLDLFAEGTLKNLLRRLQDFGVKPTDSILDYGCGNGVFLKFLAKHGFSKISGFDPYVSEYVAASLEPGSYDCVVLNDVLEHTHDPRTMMRQAAALVRPGGFLYAGTADSAGVADMKDLERHIMRLHQPFHRVVFSQEGLLKLGGELGLELQQAYLRSYMDTLLPFANYRFLDELNAALGHDMDRALDPAAGKVMLTRPSLWFFAFFGYLFPSAYEPAAIWRIPKG